MLSPWLAAFQHVWLFHQQQDDLIVKSNTSKCASKNLRYIEITFLLETAKIHLERDAGCVIPNFNPLFTKWVCSKLYEDIDNAINCVVLHHTAVGIANVLNYAVRIVQCALGSTSHCNPGGGHSSLFHWQLLCFTMHCYCTGAVFCTALQHEHV